MTLLFRAALLAGIAGGVAWMLGLLVFFGPAQAILASPDYQSAKFLAVLTQLEPLPRAAAAPWILPVGLLAIGIVYGFVYASLRAALSGPPLVKGAKFGLLAWGLMALWFEFYLPWNAMHEPAVLVLLELVLWLLVLMGTGVAIALVYETLLRRAALH